jgi:hypothetical protein
VRPDIAAFRRVKGPKEDDVMFKSTLVVVSSVLMVASLLGAAAVARGSVPHTNYLTFSARFALPGISLPAGTYIFDVVSPGSYDVVRVRDGAHVYMTLFTKRVERPRGLRADRQILFSEGRPGETPAVKVWFPVGESIGHEFLYSAGDYQVADATK